IASEGLQRVPWQAIARSADDQSLPFLLQRKSSFVLFLLRGGVIVVGASSKASDSSHDPYSLPFSGVVTSFSVASTMITAISRAGLVALAFSLTRWWEPGFSIHCSPAWYTRTGSSLTWLLTSPETT